MTRFPHPNTQRTISSSLLLLIIDALREFTLLLASLTSLDDVRKVVFSELLCSLVRLHHNDSREFL